MSNVFFQSNNGTDTTTDLNTVSATAIPVFGIVDSFSNHSNLFTGVSTTSRTSDFNGLARFSSCVYVIGDDKRTQVRSQFYLNSTPIGPVGAGGFIYDDGKADEASMVIPTYTYPILVGDVITLKTTRIYNDGVVTFASNNTSYVMIEVISEPPTIMAAQLSSTRTNYNLLTEIVKDTFINLLVLTKEDTTNMYNQDVTALTLGEVDEYLAYLKTLKYGCTNNAYTTIDISW